MSFDSFLIEDICFNKIPYVIELHTFSVHRSDCSKMRLSQLENHFIVKSRRCEFLKAPSEKANLL